MLQFAVGWLVSEGVGDDWCKMVKCLLGNRDCLGMDIHSRYCAWGTYVSFDVDVYSIDEYLLTLLRDSTIEIRSDLACMRLRSGREQIGRHIIGLVY
jgi:hypothetical protein